MSDSPVVVQFQFTRDDVRVLLRARSRIKAREHLAIAVLALALLSIAALLLQSWLLGILSLTFLGTVVGLGTLGVVPGMRRFIRQSPLVFEQRRMSIAASGIDIIVGPTSSHWDWDAVDYVSSVLDYLQIRCRGTDTQLSVPERAFADDAHRRAFLEALSDHGVEYVAN